MSKNRNRSFSFEKKKQKVTYLSILNNSEYQQSSIDLLDFSSIRKIYRAPFLFNYSSFLVFSHYRKLQFFPQHDSEIATISVRREEMIRTFDRLKKVKGQWINLSFRKPLISPPSIFLQRFHTFVVTLLPPIKRPSLKTLHHVLFYFRFESNDLIECLIDRISI